MEIDRYQHNGYDICYLIHDREKVIFILAYKREISRLKIKRDKLINNPKNEGQVKFTYKIDDINRQIKNYLDAIELLTP